MCSLQLLLSLLCWVGLFQHTSQKDITTVTPSKEVPLIEREVVGFRLWMILAFVFGGLLAIMVALCCLVDCRIPRTKQEIQADHERRNLIDKYKSHIDVQMALGRKLKVIKAKRQKRLGGVAKSAEGQKAQKAVGALVLKPPADAAPLASHPGALLTVLKAKGVGSGLGQPTQNKLARTLASLRASDMMNSLKETQSSTSHA